MEQNLTVFAVIIALMIGAPVAYLVMRLYRRLRWNRRLKKYKKTKNPRYLY